MPSALAARRLEIHAAARKDLAGFLRLDPTQVRFSLGTSLADASVPVEIAADATSIIRGATVELALLLATHHRAVVAPDDVDRLILRDDYATLPHVGPIPPSSSAAGPDLRTAIQLGPAAHPTLGGGVVSSWMSRGGRGRSLVALWIELLRQAFAEMESTRGTERTPLIVALALTAASAAAEADVRDALPGPPLDRHFRAGALAGSWLAARTGLARAWRESGRPASDPLLLQLEAALALPAFLGGRTGALQGGVTYYGLELSVGIPRAEELQQALNQGAAASEAATDVAASLRQEPDLGRRAEQAVAVARLRDWLAEGLAGIEASGNPPGLEPLRKLLVGPGALLTATADESARKVAQKALQPFAQKGKAGPLSQVAEALRTWRQKDPGASVGVSREEAHAEYAAAASALLADATLERLAGLARRALAFRTGQEAEGGADAEWEGGRLYRLSARGGPILRALEERRTGHLFTDVKDFTRRTALLGEASMAEFLRREFYGPILTAAKEHFGGMGHLADRGGVALNNLLGDAVSFSGPIEVMVLLAKLIRSALGAYASRLAREVSSEAVAKQIAAIEGAQAAVAGQARVALEQAQAALAAAPQGSPAQAAARARLQAARIEEARLAAERTKAVARARGEALEAGTFISYGPQPLVLVIEDEVFGRNRVAIAEKINESARGTARAPQARVRADAALRREQARRKNPALAHAWSVFVGQPLSLQLPPEIEEQAVRAWRAGEGAAAMRLLSAPARDALQLAAQADGDGAGDIYNSGAALSEDALECFLAEAHRTRDVHRLTLPPERIPEELRSRWFYGEEPQELVVCSQGARVLEVFRRVGRASFKGLGGVVVWELCAEDGASGALAAALGAAWVKGES